MRRLLFQLGIGAVLLLWATIGSAQETTLGGTLTDSTGGVLPGVAVTLVHEASGNTYTAVSDERGAFRLPVRTGTFKITAELAGFKSLTRTGIEVLVGQQPTLMLQMAPSALQESIQVTAAVPLVDTSQSRVGGVISQRQMTDIPVNGRAWADLALLASGSRVNAAGPSPVSASTAPPDGQFNINVDGQEVTQVLLGRFGQPGYSQDAIAEFEMVTNRFDASQGRATIAQVNVVTKAGTNIFGGTFAGFFRNDRFNAADFVAKRVIPYSDQQVSGTFGGPIVKDTLHFFGSYEYERQPRTFIFTTPFPAFNQDASVTEDQHKVLGRVDAQISPQTHLSVRGNLWRYLQPIYGARLVGGATLTPAAEERLWTFTDQVYGTLMQVLNNRMVNEVRGGYALFGYDIVSLAQWPAAPSGNSPFPEDKGLGAPMINLRGFTVGQGISVDPQHHRQPGYSVRDNITLSATKGGRHDMRFGGEVQHTALTEYACNQCNGIYNATGGAIPANLTSLFPDIMHPATWNLNGLNQIIVSYQLGVGQMSVDIPRTSYAGWFQDDWRVNAQLTLNLGVRYDFSIGLFAETTAVPPFLTGDRHADKSNAQPRLGFAYSVSDRTVIRGGWGKSYTLPTTPLQYFTKTPTRQAVITVFNDGRPDFATNPFNGATPTFDQVIASGARRSLSSLSPPEGTNPYSIQGGIGVQRQLASTVGVTVDYTYTGARNGQFSQNINLSYDPTTGRNYPFTDISHLPFPSWAVVGMTTGGAYSDYHAVNASFTKRFSQRWQASGNYLVSWQKDADGPVWSGLQPITFPLAPGLQPEYTYAAGDQRHRVVLNGIWQLGYGVQVSGLYFYGSGERFSTTYGGDLYRTGSASANNNRLRPDGTLVPRNDLVGLPLHRVDLRLQKQVALGRVKASGMVDLFNVFNHVNYGSYQTTESLPRYGAPTQNPLAAYQPRILQLGFRFAF